MHSKPYSDDQSIQNLRPTNGRSTPLYGISPNDCTNIQGGIGHHCATPNLWLVNGQESKRWPLVTPRLIFASVKLRWKVLLLGLHGCFSRPL